MDLNPTNYKEQVLTALNWKPFRYNTQNAPGTDTVIGWEGTPSTTQWDTLERQLRNYFATNNPPTNDQERQANVGRLMLAHSFYMGLTEGYVTMTDPCPNLSCQVKPSPNSSADLAKGVTGTGKGIGGVVQLAIDELLQWAGARPLPWPILLTSNCSSPNPTAL